jgi:hypothetical protein
MKMEQMLAHLLAEIRSGHGMMAEIMAKMDTETAAIRARTKARQDKMMEAYLNACRKETVTCQETIEAHLGCKEPSPKEMESQVEHREVPMEEAAVKSSRVMKTQHRGQHLAAGRRREPKELTRGDCGSQGMLAAACRKMSRHAAVAWWKRNLSSNIQTRGNCGSLRKLTVAGRKMIRCARGAWYKRVVVRGNWIRAKVQQGTQRAGTPQEGKMGRA